MSEEQIHELRRDLGKVFDRLTSITFHDALPVGSELTVIVNG